MGDVLADALNGYVWNWKLYTGKEEDSPSSLGLGHRVVLDLLDDDRLKDKGYQVYMDNFYSSPERGFEACGTLRSNRVGIPEDIRSAKLKKGESWCQYSQDGSILFMKWRDKWDVLMLSMFHDDTFIEKRPRTQHAGKIFLL